MVANGPKSGSPGWNTEGQRDLVKTEFGGLRGAMGNGVHRVWWSGADLPVAGCSHVARLEGLASTPPAMHAPACGRAHSGGFGLGSSCGACEGRKGSQLARRTPTRGNALVHLVSDPETQTRAHEAGRCSKAGGSGGQAERDADKTRPALVAFGLGERRLERRADVIWHGHRS
jgi:hypothetical protein